MSNSGIDGNNHDEVRKSLEALFPEVMTREEMQDRYEVTGFSSPFVVVTRQIDGKRGSLYFTHYPRFYYGFQEG